MQDAKDLYLDLMKKCLTFSLWEESFRLVDPTIPRSFPRKLAVNAAVGLLDKMDIGLVKKISLDPEARREGRHWPAMADSMIGLPRLSNIQACVEDVLHHQVPGDLIETGVWRGGATILMRAVLKAHQVTNRTVWVADSFEGLPPPDPAKYPADAQDVHYQFSNLKVTLEQVKANFAKYDLLDEQVKFLKGWFSETLPSAPIEKLAVLRLDGDMYESTLDALKSLYPKLSVGGFVIVDDYALTACQAAVQDFRAANGIRDEIKQIDWTGVYWQRVAAA